MPHFDAFGGDEWICQICCGTYDSRTRSAWRKDITECDSAGNVCPGCVRQHNITGLTGERLRRSVQRAHSQSSFSETHPASQKHEQEVQTELKRLGIRNKPRPTFCAMCGTRLMVSRGLVGETVLGCNNKDCNVGVVWEDQEQAIRNVY